VPVLVYLLGEPVKDATTESLLVVGTAALVGAADDARIGRVELRTGLTFGAAGAGGAIVGTALNRLVGGRSILLAVAVLLLVAAVAMLRRAPESPSGGKKPSVVRVAPVGFGTGVLTGFFGVGGGFVIAPGARASARVAADPGGRNLAAGDRADQRCGARRPPGQRQHRLADRDHLRRRRGRRRVGRPPAFGTLVNPQRLGQLFALLLVAIAVFSVAANVPALL
jgi:hypothetical protein